MTPYAYYSLASGRLQGVWMPHTADEQPADLPGQGKVALDGAFAAKFSENGPALLEEVQAHITAETGLSPYDANGNELDRFVWVKDGVVVDHIGRADPAIHVQNFADKNAAWPNAQMVAEPIAVEGWTQNQDGTFSPPPLTAEELANQQAKANRGP